ncbi:MAG TPA: MmcQ/YjbR family DNA-binding protein [Chitinophagaceae bacterium]|nr:MmcQ/YjbR family DNA-binding protein [Chitinophagaceae bacterium]
MDAEEIRNYALSKPEAWEDTPFGEGNLVFKFREKMFLLLSLDSSPVTFNVKCDPLRAVSLREQYDAVQPGYHMNKKHWNTITVDGTLGSSLLKEMIDHSFELIGGRQTRKKK